MRISTSLCKKVISEILIFNEKKRVEKKRVLTRFFSVEQLQLFFLSNYFFLSRIFFLKFFRFFDKIKYLCYQVGVLRGGELRTFGGPKNSTVQSSIFRPKVLLANFRTFKSAKVRTQNFQKIKSACACESSAKFYVRTFAPWQSAKVRQQNFWPENFSYGSKF